MREWERERCTVCGGFFVSEEPAVVENQRVCGDCLRVYCGEAATVRRRLPGFLREREGDFLPWVFRGDAYLTEEERLDALRDWYRRWRPWHREAAEQAERDFMTSSPGEWEDYLTGR